MDSGEASLFWDGGRGGWHFCMLRMVAVIFFLQTKSLIFEKLDPILIPLKTFTGSSLMRFR